MSMIIKLVRKILQILSRFTVVLFVLFVAAVAAFVWSYMNYQKAKDQLHAQGAQALSQQEVRHIVRSVGKLIMLPEGEPTIAVIKDVTALQQQPFFKNAQNGDVVLVYKEQAIIYSPKRGIVVNVGPVVKDQNTTSTPSEVAAPVETSVEVRNGSTIVGKATNVGDEIDALDGFKVATTTNAKNKDYAKTIIVNLKAKDVSALESKFGVTAVTALPVGEASSTADVVVILGNK